MPVIIGSIRTLSAAPALAPALTLLPMGPSLPGIPVTPIMPGSPILPIVPQGPIMPFSPRRSVMPIVSAPAARALNVNLLSAPSQDSTPANDVIASREKLDGIFDGRKQPVEKSEADESGPVRSGRHVSLPENDLEKEIGAY